MKILETFIYFLKILDKYKDKNLILRKFGVSPPELVHI